MVLASKRESAAGEKAAAKAKPAASAWDNVLSLAANKEPRHDEPALGES
jgi:hypothetical protein